MKTVFFYLLIAAGLALGACTHTTDQTAALSVDEIHAELAVISRQLNSIAESSAEDFRQDRIQSRTLAFMRRATASSGYMSSPVVISPQPPSHTYPVTKVRSLLSRRDELSAQLARINKPQS